MTNDPFALPPRLWFGVLCQGLGTDQVGQITLQGVFNQVAFFNPPQGVGVAPHAFLNAVLAVGFSEGLGHFEAEIDLRDMDENVLWQRPKGKWSFDLGPGADNAAVLAEQVRHWITQPGKYHFRLQLAPTGQEHQILFEVAEKIGPAVTPDSPLPPAPPS